MPTPFEEFWGISEQDVIDAINQGQASNLPAGMAGMIETLIDDPGELTGPEWGPGLKYGEEEIPLLPPPSAGEYTYKPGTLGSLYGPGDSDFTAFYKWLRKASLDSRVLSIEQIKNIRLDQINRKDGTIRMVMNKGGKDVWQSYDLPGHVPGELWKNSGSVEENGNLVRRPITERMVETVKETKETEVMPKDAAAAAAAAAGYRQPSYQAPAWIHPCGQLRT